MANSKVLNLYKALLREGTKFSDYNFRSYALMRTKDAFRSHQNETDPVKISQFLNEAQENLNMVKRQVIIGQLYAVEHHILDK